MHDQAGTQRRYYCTGWWDWLSLSGRGIWYHLGLGVAWPLIWWVLGLDSSGG